MNPSADTRLNVEKYKRTREQLREMGYMVGDIKKSDDADINDGDDQSSLKQEKAFCTKVQVSQSHLPNQLKSGCGWDFHVSIEENVTRLAEKRREKCNNNNSNDSTSNTEKGNENSSTAVTTAAAVARK